jgi:NAD+ synthase (glutamine-hydrolysing)
MIRPKMSLANDGNYREFRWFSAWPYKDKLVDYQLPVDVSEAISQETVPFGYGYIQFLDV